MKAISINCLSVLLSLLALSCQKDGNSNDEDASATKSQAITANSVQYPKTGWLPQGTSFEMKGDKMVTKAPADWSYIGYDRNGNVVLASSNVMSAVSCTCNTTGTCKPFHASSPAGSTSGCTGTCTNCTMKQSLFIKNDPYMLSSGGYFNISAPVRMIKAGEQVPAAFDALFLELPAFKEQLLRFLVKAHAGTPMALPVKNDDGSVSAPAGYALIAVSIMGRGLITIVPEEFAKGQPGYVLMKKASCDCTNGGCTLKNYTVLGTGSIWCEGNCTGTCTLTTSAVNIQQNIRLYSFTF